MTVEPANIDVRRLPVVVDLPTAARLLGIGRTSAYELVRTGRWPTPVIRVGRLIRVPTAPLLARSAPARVSDATPAGPLHLTARLAPVRGVRAPPRQLVPPSPRPRDGQTIRDPTTVSGGRASDLHFLCSGGRI